MVEASRRHGRWSWRRMHSVAAGPTRMTDVLTTAPNETELEEAGSRRLLAAVDELSERTSHLKRRREQLWASLARVEPEPSRHVPPEQRRAHACPNRRDVPGSAEDGSVERGRGDGRRSDARGSARDSPTGRRDRRDRRARTGHLDGSRRRVTFRQNERRVGENASARSTEMRTSTRVMPSRRFDRRARAGCIATAAAAPRRPSTFCAKALRGRAFRRSACPPPKL